jgi:hypothetical protein
MPLGFIHLLKRRHLSALSPIAVMGLMLRGMPVADDATPNFYTVKAVGQDFAPHYTQHIKPQCDEYEMLRMDALTRMRRRLWLAFGVTGFVIISAFFMRDWLFGHKRAGDTINFLFHAGLALMAVIWGWAIYPGITYQQGVKQGIYPAVFQFFGADYRFDHGGSGMSVESLQPSGLIAPYHNCHQEDYVTGTHKGVKLELVEARLTRVEGTGKNRRTVVVFNGICARFSMNKPFKGRTMVKKDAGMLLNWAQDKKGLGKSGAGRPGV